MQNGSSSAGETQDSKYFPSPTTAWPSTLTNFLAFILRSNFQKKLTKKRLEKIVNLEAQIHHKFLANKNRLNLAESDDINSILIYYSSLSFNVKLKIRCCQ
jgi:subtilase family serine protease